MDQSGCSSIFLQKSRGSNAKTNVHVKICTFYKTKGKCQISRSIFLFVNNILYNIQKPKNITFLSFLFILPPHCSIFCFFLKKILLKHWQHKKVDARKYSRFIWSFSTYISNYCIIKVYVTYIYIRFDRIQFIWYFPKKKQKAVIHLLRL